VAVCGAPAAAPLAERGAAAVESADPAQYVPAMDERDDPAAHRVFATWRRLYPTAPTRITPNVPERAASECAATEHAACKRASQEEEAIVFTLVLVLD